MRFERTARLPSPGLMAGLACTWMPHWACHFFRLGSGSTFVVGSWSFSALDSWMSLALYSAIVGVCLSTVSRESCRDAALLISGTGHLIIGALHAVRLVAPFRFEILGQAWTLTASAVQAFAFLTIAGVCFFVFGARWRLRDLGRSGVDPARPGDPRAGHGNG